MVLKDVQYVNLVEVALYHIFLNEPPPALESHDSSRILFQCAQWETNGAEKGEEKEIIESIQHVCYKNLA